MTATSLPRFVTYRAEVIRVQSLGDRFVRVTFGGAGLTGFDCAGTAPKIKVWLPSPGDIVPESGPFDEVRGRSLMRTYTVRAHRPEVTEVDIDFVVHSEGPAGRWADSARPGQVILLSNASGYPPVAGTRILFIGDPSSLPAIMTALEAQRTGDTARVILVVDHATDKFDLEAPATTITDWLVTAGDVAQLEAAARNAIEQFGPDYVWAAGEAGALKPLRKFLRGEAGFDRSTSHVVGYWRRDTTADTFDSETIAHATSLIEAGVELTRQEMDELSLGESAA